MKKITPFQIVNVLIMTLIVTATLYPFLNIVALSFSSETAVIKGLVTIIPKDFSLAAYEMTLNHKNFWVGYRNTVWYTILSVVIHLFLTICCAYPLSKTHLKGRKQINGLIIFTMFFGGGMIPTFLLVRALGMINTVWAIVLPGAINVWHMIIMRTFFMGIPDSLEEAAAIDGLNPVQILVRIILPLSKAILATVTLFVAVWQWNSWFAPLIYLNENSKYPIALFLRNIVMGAQIAAKEGQIQNAVDAMTPGETLKAATIVLVTIPILCVYPFAQKYFIKGVMVGSVKG